MMQQSLLSLVVASAAAEMSFEEFQFQYGKVYNGVDTLEARRGIFHANVGAIVAHNAKNASWTMAVNEHADLTQEEFLGQFTGKMPTGSSDLVNEDEEPAELAVEMEVASSIDWVSKGKVNDIQSQSASDCWAYSAAGALESVYAIKRSKLYKLSEQQLCDCGGSDIGTCKNGGDEDAALLYYQKHGACSERSYPETGRDASCKESKCDVQVKAGVVTGRKWVKNTASDWKKYLNQNPFTMSVWADNLMFYSSGVIADAHEEDANGIVTTKCKGRVDHAIIAVGYGTDGSDYFKVRNSWGKSWGEKGYARFKSTSGDGTACMFKYKASFPIISSHTEDVMV